MNRKKLFTKKFADDFEANYQYIYKDSPQNAKKFAEELDSKIEKIKEQPTAFPPESALPTKKNWYRFAIFMNKWKVIYKVTSELLIFLAIVHTHRHEKQIKRIRTNKYQ